MPPRVRIQQLPAPEGSATAHTWLIGDDDEVVVVDAGQPADAVAAAVGARRVLAVLATHARPGHIETAPALAARTGAPVLLHPADLPLWRAVHPDADPDGPLADAQRIPVADAELTVLHTPGATPGGVCLLLERLGAALTGDTLHRGGPGCTGPTPVDLPTVHRSIRTHLLPLPLSTTLHPAHGPATTLAAETPGLTEGR